jgi:hypothetical protein
VYILQNILLHSNKVNRTCKVTVYICSVYTYAYGCVIGLRREETANNLGNEKKCSLDQYHVLQFLGKGAFGNVTLVKRMSAGCSGCKQELCAMKSVSKDAFCNYFGSRRIVKKEVFVRAVGRPFLVQLHSYFETKVLHIFLNVHIFSQY